MHCVVLVCYAISNDMLRQQVNHINKCFKNSVSLTVDSKLSVINNDFTFWNSRKVRSLVKNS